MLRRAFNESRPLIVGLVSTLVLLGTGAAFAARGLAYEVVSVIDGGRVEGTITISPTTKAKVPVTQAVTKDPDVCGDTRTTGQDLSPGDSLSGAIVFLKGVRQGKPFAAPARSVVVQEGCRFLVNTRIVHGPGAALAVENNDPITHNIHVSEVIGRGFRAMHNVGQYPGDPDLDLPISLFRGNVIRLTCGIHDFMENWVFVADNPYYAVTDELGRFAIDDAPAGTYKLGVWHPQAVLTYREVAVAPRGATGVDVAVSLP